VRLLINRAQFDLDQYEEATATFEHATEHNPQDDRAFMYLAAAYGYLNRIEDAKSAIRKANTLRFNTSWSELNLGDISYWKWTGNPQKLQDGLVKAGVEHGRDWYARLTSLVGAKYK